MKALERHTTILHCIFHNFLLANFWHILIDACWQPEKWNYLGSGHCWTSLGVSITSSPCVSVWNLCVQPFLHCPVFLLLLLPCTIQSHMTLSPSEMRTGTICTCFFPALDLHHFPSFSWQEVAKNPVVTKSRTFSELLVPLPPPSQGACGQSLPATLSGSSSSTFITLSSFPLEQYIIHRAIYPEPFVLCHKQAFWKSYDVLMLYCISY